MIKKFEQWAFHWWGPFFFGCACLGWYEWEGKQYKALYSQFEQQKKNLEIEKEQGFLLQQKLQKQIDSQNDPAWVELILMSELGLVVEGQVKAFFVEAK